MIANMVFARTSAPDSAKDGPQASDRWSNSDGRVDHIRLHRGPRRVNAKLSPVYMIPMIRLLIAGAACL